MESRLRLPLHNYRNLGSLTERADYNCDFFMSKISFDAAIVNTKIGNNFLRHG